MTDDSVILPYIGLALTSDQDEYEGVRHTSLAIETVLAVRIPRDTSEWNERAIYTLENGWLSNVLELATPADIERIVLDRAAHIAEHGHLGEVDGCEPWVTADKFDPAWWPDR